MFKNLDKTGLITDLVKVATFNIVANILMNLRFGEPLLDQKFLYSLVFILVGFAAYHIFLHRRVVKLVDRHLSESAKRVKKSSVSSPKKK